MWTAMAVETAKSDAGATMTRQADGSVLASGVNGAEDRYELVSGELSGAVAAVKLEALADPSMVGGGPGRAPNGNIGLSRIRVYEKMAGGEEREVKLAKAVADFEQNSGGLSVASALDENPKTGWAVDPQFGKDHAAVFTLAEPLPAGSRRMRVVLEFQLNGQHNMGRVRVSVSEQPGAGLGGEAIPAGVVALLEKAKAAAGAGGMADGHGARGWATGGAGGGEPSVAASFREGDCGVA